AGAAGVELAGLVDRLADEQGFLEGADWDGWDLAPVGHRFGRLATADREALVGEVVLELVGEEAQGEGVELGVVSGGVEAAGDRLHSRPECPLPTWALRRWLPTGPVRFAQ